MTLNSAGAADNAPSDITDYHAHVYFDADSRQPARLLREAVQARFEDIEMGRWHEKPVGPHPMWSYQIKFDPPLLPEIIPWLMLNRRGLTIFLHPNTGNALRDHEEFPAWLGESKILKLDMFRR